MRRRHFRELLPGIDSRSLRGDMIPLPKGHLWSSPTDLRGMSVECGGGILWVTQEGDVQDYILEAGDRFVVARRGSVVVQACTDARLCIAPPLAPASPRVNHETARPE